MEKTECYNNAIRQLAEKNDSLLADVWAGQGTTDWLIHPDGVHANKVGNLIIAHQIFETIAQHCSGLTTATYARDARTEWTRDTTDYREKDGDPFDPWWIKNS